MNQKWLQAINISTFRCPGIATSLPYQKCYTLSPYKEDQKKQLFRVILHGVIMLRVALIVFAFARLGGCSFKIAMHLAALAQVLTIFALGVRLRFLAAASVSCLGWWSADR